MPALVFDMDGTLIDNQDYHVQSWRDLLAELGVSISTTELLEYTAGVPNDAALRRILGLRPSDAQLRAYAERKEVLYRSLYRPHLRLIDGAAQFIKRARGLGLPLAVATSAGPENVTFVLDGLGIRDSFQAVVGAGDVAQGKPHPEIFLTAAARLGVPANTCIVFEDSLPGIEAAHRAGSRAVAVTTTLAATAFQDLPGIIRIVRDYVNLDPAAVVASWAKAE